MLQTFRVATLAALGLTFVVAQPQRLVAQDFFHAGVTALTEGRAGIYSPAAGDALDAISLNPAGLTAVGSRAGNAILTGGMARGSFSDVTNDDSKMRLRPQFAPYGAYAAHAGPLSWGLGVTPDFVSSVNWRYADAPGTGGADYGVQSEKSEIVVVRGTAGAALAIGKRMSIGASAGVVYDENTLIAPYIFQNNAALKGLKTLLDLHTRGVGWGGSFGITAQPATRLTLQAGYSSPFNVHSKGHASGSLSDQFAVLNIPLQPDFTYTARVGVKLPQSIAASARWQATRTLGLDLGINWDNFHSAFRSLPIDLRDGSNADINGFLGTNRIVDLIPLNWSNQTTGRVAFDRTVGKHSMIEAGYLRRSSLVPNGTITPLTGAIMKNGVSAGFGHDIGHIHTAAGYSFQFNQSAHVITSGLEAGEYDNSRLTVGTQALVLELSWHR